MNNLTLAEAAEDVVRRIESLGVRCEANSRFRRYATVLAKGYIEPDDPDHAIARESIRDVRTMQFALSELMGKAPVEALCEKVRLAVKDGCLPQEGSNQSPGRDIQCELYVAAVCARAGMQFAIEEPDVTCVVGGDVYGIAVKRLKSRPQLEKRFRKGASQVSQAGVKGVIAIDMSQAFNSANCPLITNGNNREIQLERQGRMNDYVTSLHKKMLAWLVNREVRGLLFIDHIVSYDIATEKWHLESTSFRVPFTQHDQVRQREFDVFWDAYKQGIVNLQWG